uniref:Uncharacterized protein n=1 Tax=Ciona intestinalis TaxID=7719 RepID=F6XGW2_CIOIN
GTGVYRSYIARAECMAHLGDQRAAVLDFSAAIEVNPLCVEGLCGRAFMRLALGEEYDCVNDVTSACELDIYAVTDHILGLPDEAKKLLLFWIGTNIFVVNCRQIGMEKAEILQKSMGLGKLLITVDNSNPTWHGMYADILIALGEFDEALRHLQLVMDLSPNDVTAVARAGLINVKMNRFQMASALLSSLADVDKNGLLYVLKAIDSSRRRKLAEETIKQAEALISVDKYAEARSYYSLSLLTDPSSKIDKLRRRSRCLLKMGENSKAIADISEVIKETATRPQVNDYCVRGNLHLVTGKEFLACKDFMQAIELERHQAISLIHVKPGRTVLCSIFYQQAVEAFSKHDYQGCHDICEMGLVIDGDDIEMRKLRARAKREISKCIVQ